MERLRLKIALWLWARLTKYIVAHRPDAKRLDPIAIQGPNFMYMDGIWMPDKHQTTQM